MEWDNLMFSLVSVCNGFLANKTKSIRVMRAKQENHEEDSENPKSWLSIDLRVWTKDGVWTPTGIRLKVKELLKLHDLLEDGDDEIRTFSNNCYYRRTLYLIEDEDDTSTEKYAVLLEKDKVTGVMLQKREITRLLRIIPPMAYFVEHFDIVEDVAKDILFNCMSYILYKQAAVHIKSLCQGCKQKGNKNQYEVLTPVEHTCVTVTSSSLVGEKWFEDLLIAKTFDKDIQTLFIKVMSFFEKPEYEAVSLLQLHFNEQKQSKYLRDGILTAFHNDRSPCFELACGIANDELMKDVPHPSSLLQKRKRKC